MWLQLDREMLEPHTGGLNMQVDSAPPFTSVAQQMGQAPSPPPPQQPQHQPDQPRAKPSSSDGAGKAVDVTV